MTNPSPTPTQVEVESVDTKELQRLLDKYAGEAGPDISECVSRIITARVAAERVEYGLLKLAFDQLRARLEQAESALAASQAAPAKAEGWISCDTALPDSARDCLAVYVTPSWRQRRIRAFYAKQYEIEASGDECDSEYREEDDTEWLKAGWYECIDNWGEYSSVTEKAEAPAEETKGDEDE